MEASGGFARMEGQSILHGEGSNGRDKPPSSLAWFTSPGTLSFNPGTSTKSRFRNLQRIYFTMAEMMTLQLWMQTAAKRRKEAIFTEWASPSMTQTRKESRPR